MARRYQYDRDGNLKGFTSSTREYSTRSMVTVGTLALIFAYVHAWLNPQPSTPPKSPTPSQIVASPKPLKALADHSKKKRKEVGIGRKDKTSPPRETAQAAEVHRTPLSTLQPVSDDADFIRDLKPYYERECGKGDVSACQSLTAFYRSSCANGSEESCRELAAQK